MLLQVIVITGTTSSGKSSLAQALQEVLLPEVWLSFSLDSVIYTLPPSLLERCNLEDNWQGIDGSALCSGAFACLRALVENGNAVIFDAVISHQKLADGLIQSLVGINYIHIHLHCDWENIEQRTITRGDRTLKEAKRSYEMTQHFLTADISLNTSNKSSQELAAEVLAYIRKSVPSVL